MASYNNRPQSSHQSSFAPSAPSLPESFDQHNHSYNSPPPPSQPDYRRQNHYHQQPPPSYSEGYPQQHPPPPPAAVAAAASSYGSSSYGSFGFPPGTHPDVIRSFEMVDRDRSGYIDDKELQQALSAGYQKFSIGTVRLLMFIFKNPNDSLRIGPGGFASLWGCLGQWRGIFERYDKDRSGKIDLFELRDALFGIGYAVPPSVLKILIEKYDDASGRKIELNFDSFVECAMIVKGLTEKFKQKDSRYTGTATFTYDEFMSSVLPFLVAYD